MNPLALPVALVQGMWVRVTTEVLPPAAGPTTGSAGGPSRPPLRLAVLGESTAAGCGVGAHPDGFTGQLADRLAERHRRPVEWQVVGRHGATARRIRYRLLPQLAGDLEVVVLLAGVNDVLTRRSPAQWGDDVAAIVGDLTQRADRVAMTGVPPFTAFPSLPTTLARYLADRARALDAVARRVCAEHPRASWIGSTDILPDDTDIFASDGFHPSSTGYRRWADAVAEHLAP